MHSGRIHADGAFNASYACFYGISMRECVHVCDYARRPARLQRTNEVPPLTEQRYLQWDVRGLFATSHMPALAPAQPSSPPATSVCDLPFSDDPK